jgi:hypothetical protein
MTKAKPETEIIILHETVLQSYLVDSSTFLLFVALIGVGVYLDSTVLQFIGGLMGIATICARHSRHNRMTIDEARKRLDELEAA